jgi:threonine dehydratase
VAAAIKQSPPDVAVIGVEPSGAASMKNAIDAGEVTTLEHAKSIADGLMAVRPGDLNFAHVRKFVDRIDTVDDAEIAAAVRWLFVSAKIVAEPSGAATVAAALRESAAYVPPVVAIVSGGNLDPRDLAKYVGA